MSIVSRLIKNAIKDVYRGIKGNPLPGTYHRDPFRAQQLLLRNQNVQTIFDVGGNRGQSVKEYRDFFPSAKIYSFEPFGGVMDKLTQACQTDGNAVAVQAAVSDENGSQTLYVTARTTMNSLKRISRKYQEHQTVVPQEVRTVTLDSFCETEGVTHIDVLKLDIQGGELLALRGAAGLLAAHVVDVIYSEVLFTTQYEQQTEVFQLHGYLHKLGYQVFGFYGQRINSSHILQHANAIFISPRVVGELNRAAA